MGSCKVLSLKYVVEQCEKLLLQRDSLMLSNLAGICGRKKLCILHSIPIINTGCIHG
jgi:hypothetical protein